MKPTSKKSPVSLSRLGSVLSMSALAASALMLSAGQLSAQTQTTTVYQSDFSANRNGWFNYTSSAGLYVADGALVGTNNPSQFLTYFNSTSLAVGESIQVQFGIALQGSDATPETPATIPNTDLALRIGLLNSNGSKVTADNFGQNNDVFTGYTGYRFATNPSNTSNQNRTQVARRGVGTNKNPLGSSPWTNLGTGNATNLTAGLFYPVVITISRTDAQTLGLSFSLNNVIVNTTDINPDSFAFDTLVFNKITGFPGDILINNVTISYSQIPEAGQTATAIGVIVAFAAVFMARRRKSRS